MYKAVIFDLDGVICFTDEYHYLAWKKIADTIGVQFDRKKNNRLRGVSRMDSLEIILEGCGREFSNKEKQTLAEEKNSLYREYLRQLTPKDVSEDVRKTLDSLREGGYRLVVGSSSKNTGFILDRIGLSDYFDVVSDGNMITKSKPDPEVFLKAAELLNMPPKLCVVVEDAAAGAEAARRGGFACAGIGEAAEYPGIEFKLSKISDLLHCLNVHQVQRGHG